MYTWILVLFVVTVEVFFFFNDGKNLIFRELLLDRTLNKDLHF